jgi:non-ribosomal peptide synthetase component F
VTVTHGSVVNLLSSMQREPGMSQADVLLAVTTLSFDIAVLELELPLSVGARLVVATREQARDGAALCGLIERHGVTMMQGTPATWRLMVSAGFAAREGLTMLCGGEALPRGLAAELSRASGALWNVYGPTETTIWSLVSRVPSSGVIPIGRAIGNTQAYVLDGQQEPLPAGVEGELYVGGAGVARGYLGRSELTSERFVPDPFSAEPGARLYRTGDLGRWLADGTLEYLGRNDHQVKIRGYRIELGEIESRLSTLAGVDEVVVVAWEDVLGDRHLVAYYAGDPLPAESMRAHASGSLPAYMVPSVYVHVGALPVTANGKLDRRALPSPTGDEVVSRGYEAPQGEVEQALADIWSERLQVARVGRNDHFFELGGHSIAAMQVMTRVEQRFGVSVPLLEVFENPTLASFASVIVDAQLAQYDPDALMRLASDPSADGK